MLLIDKLNNSYTIKISTQEKENLWGGGKELQMSVKRLLSKGIIASIIFLLILAILLENLVMVFLIVMGVIIWYLLLLPGPSTPKEERKYTCGRCGRVWSKGELLVHHLSVDILVCPHCGNGVGLYA